MHIGLSGWQREAAGDDHQGLLRLFQRADTLGFDSVWLAEYHFRRSGLPYPSPLLLAAATFAVTERLRVGTGVVLLPQHHPLLLAEALAQLDRQGNGRLDVGIGRGNDDAALRAIGVDPASKHERFVAAYELLVRAWTHGRVASADGPWQFGETEVGPPPTQQPHPPLYIAGASHETIQFAVERGLPHLFSLEPPEDRQLQRWQEVVGPGQPLVELGRSSLARYLFIGRTEEEAFERLDRALLPILRRRRSQPVDVTDREAVARARANLVARQAVVGTPDQCVEQIQAIAREIGTGHLRLTINALGGLGMLDTLEQLELFGREALAACREIVPTEGVRAVHVGG
ncbi:MAG: LLM class flavin-dependent oxidoreductase [Chloroflexi bacterium]|nr:LLM class flavin-dependent oxidoreductase [Chloroflexota bacterium]